MRICMLDILLEQDVVLPRQAASAGAPDSLDYLPGSTLLGAAAAKLYAQLPEAQAWQLFHAGDVRFGNGLPVGRTGPAWPVPRCLYRRKEGAWKTPGPDAGQRLLVGEAPAVFNRMHAPNLPGTPTAQAKQLRHGYLTGALELVVPPRTLTLRTAVDPDLGRAQEGQLFAYQALAAGTRLRAELLIANSVPEQLTKRLLEALSGTLYVGRSRSAEHGRIRVQAAQTHPEARNDAPGTELTLWAISDIALQDALGMPLLAPQPEDLGLGAGSLQTSHSFIATRAYAPYNAARRLRDLERQLIAAGSVLKLQLQAPADPAALRALRQGIGLYTEAGLGRFLINPPILAHAIPQAQPAEPLPALPPMQEAPRPQAPPLIGWMSRQRDRRGDDEGAERQAAAWFADYVKALSRIANHLGLGAGESTGPSAAQWGNVIRAAETAGGAENIRRQLFLDKHAVCRASAKNWGDQFPAKSGLQTLGQWLEQQLQGDFDPAALLAFAHRAQKQASQDRTAQETTA